MRKGQCYYEEIIHALQRAHSLLPKCTMGQHLGTALDGWGDVCSLRDEEIMKALKEYIGTMEASKQYKEEDLSDIISSGLRIHAVIIEERYNGEDNE